MPFYNRFPLRLLPIILLLSLPFSAECKDNAAQEKKLTKRVDEFYHYFVTAEWAKITPFVSKDTQSVWLGVNKGTIKSYKIDTIELAPGNKTAKVIVMVTNSFSQAYNAPFTQAQRSDWIYEKGAWFVKIRQPPPLSQQFALVNPSPTPPAPPTPPIAFEQNPVKLLIRQDGADSVRTVYFQIAIPVAVRIENLRTNCDCLKVAIDHAEFPPVGEGMFTLTYHANSSNPPPPLVVEATIAPLGYQLRLPVELESPIP